MSGPYSVDPYEAGVATCPHCLEDYDTGRPHACEPATPLVDVDGADPWAPRPDEARR